MEQKLNKKAIRKARKVTEKMARGGKEELLIGRDEDRKEMEKLKCAGRKQDSNEDERGGGTIVSDHELV